MLRPRTALGRDRRSKAQMARLKPLRRDFFVRSVHVVAPDLIGATLLFKGVGGVIVEVEAYHHTDPAAHSFGGRTNSSAQSGDGQWLFYRSLGPVGNRTVLGQNISGEFTAGRFPSSGKFKQWIEIEAV